MLASFSGRVYGLRKGCIYVLTNFTKNKWKWNFCSWSPGNVTHISTTKDHKKLILQNCDTIRIYSEEDKMEKLIKKDKCIRKYDNINEYVDYYPDEFYYKSDNIVNHVKDVELYKGKIYPVYETDTYDNIRICNGEPFYF